jgi:thiol-disulfide isomerase/thioredoxin
MEILLLSSLSCVPCKAIKPIVERLSERTKVPYRVVNREHDTQGDFNKYNFTSVPTIIILKDNKPMWSRTGFINESELLGHINKYKEM